MQKVSVGENGVPRSWPPAAASVLSRGRGVFRASSAESPRSVISPEATDFPMATSSPLYGVRAAESDSAGKLLIPPSLKCFKEETALVFQPIRSQFTETY